MRRCPQAPLAGAIPFLALPRPAFAHAAIQGVDEFAAGILHPLMTPAHVLVLLSLGLLLGQHPPLRLKTPLLSFAVFAAAALCATTFHLAAAVPQSLILALALCGAIFVSAAWPMPAPAQAILFAAAALAVGFDSAVGDSPSRLAEVKTLLGIWVSLIITLVSVAFYVSLLPPKKWLQIAVRIAGSWIIAITVMMLAFLLRR